MRTSFLLAAAAVVAGALVAPSMAWAQGDAAAASGPVVVLDNYSVWRMFHVLKPPVIAMPDGPAPVMTPQKWLNEETAPAPANWTSVEFDATGWRKGSSKVFARTPYLADLCVRGQFEVTDPAAVAGLKLDLSYYGGVVVYLNGQEVARGDIEAGAAMAKAYPREAFITDDGKLMPGGWQAERHKKQMELRQRSLSAVELPAKHLRKGTNVVAVHVVRAPYDKVIDELKAEQEEDKRRDSRGCPYDLSWSTCELRNVRLVADGPTGVVANTGRPEGLQVWNGDLLTPDYLSSTGDRCEPLRPMAIRGVRNGWYSGKVLLGSSAAIEGLKAQCSDLAQAGATIPSSAIRVRYGTSWEGSRVADNSQASAYDAPVLDALLEKPLDVFPAQKYGTTVPVWVTLKVPADARAGRYTGKLTITAKGQDKAIEVPVELDVADFRLPDPLDRRTLVELMQSPGTLAAEYNVPMWSDEHWKLIGESLRYIGEIGAGMVYIPLIAQTNSGNAESMVRWMPKGDGTYDYDFSVMDRYLDLVAKEIGTPSDVIFVAWEVYLKAPKEEVVINEGDSDYVKMEKSWAAARWSQRDKGPAVTTKDPKTGELTMVYLPRYEAEGAAALWKPLFDALHERMAKRGWEKAMKLGMASDSWPSKEELTTLKDVSGNLPWVMHTHGGGSRVGDKMLGIAPVGYIAYVWDVQFGPDPSEGRMYGWQQEHRRVQFRRFTALNTMPSAGILNFEELNITGRQRGLGRIGADFWPAVRDKRGRRAGMVWGPYPQSMWHSLNLSSHMLVPGPEGPLASTRYEVLREGIQEAETRVAIEKVLTDEARKAKLGAEMADRAQKFLDDRLRDVFRSGSSLGLSGRDYASSRITGDSWGGLAGHCWYLSSGWEAKNWAFYNLAAEVTAKAGAK